MLIARSINTESDRSAPIIRKARNIAVSAEILLICGSFKAFGKYCVFGFVDISGILLLDFRNFYRIIGKRFRRCYGSGGFRFRGLLLLYYRNGRLVYNLWFFFSLAASRKRKNTKRYLLS